MHVLLIFVFCLFDADENGFGFELPKWLFEEQNKNMKQDVQFKVIVPSGLVVAVDANQPSKVVWQRKVRTANTVQ